MSSDTPGHVGRRSRELKDLRDVIRSEGRLWGWGTDETLIPWEDRHGRTMLVFWKSEARAVEENDQDSEPGEKPLPFAVATLLDKLAHWERVGVGVIGLEPQAGRVLYSLNLDEFRDLLLDRPRSRPIP